MFSAIFLDRDGVIIENRRDYVRRWDDVVFIPNVLPALKEISSFKSKIFIITNQSGIGRGLISAEIAEEINEQLKYTIEEAGGRIDGIYTCPHSPVEDCACRKPKPGLLLEAALAHSISLPQSLMIGDALSDILAGRAAGINNVALVLTGRGSQQIQLLQTETMDPFPIYKNLPEALSNLIRKF